MHQSYSMSFDKHLQQSLVWRGFYFLTLFSSNVVLSRFLLASGSGMLFYFSTIFSLVVVVLGISLESAFTYYASSNTVEDRKLIFFGVIWSVAVTTLLYFLLPYYFSNYEHYNIAQTKLYTEYGCLYTSGILLTNYTLSLYYSKGNYYLPNMSMGLLNVLFIASMFYLHFEVKDNNLIMRSYFLYNLCQGLLLLIVYKMVLLKGKLVSPPDSTDTAKVLKFAFACFMANLVFFLVYRIDFWFVKANCTADDLGNYIQASKLGQMLLIIPQIIASAIFPRTATGEDSGDIVSAIRSLSRIMLQCFIGVIILTALLGKVLFVALFGNSFSIMYLPMLLLLPGIFCLCNLALMSAYFGGKGKVKVNLIGAFLALIVVLLGNILMLKHYSIAVAATVSTIGYAVNYLYSIIQFKKCEVDYKIIDLFRWNKADWNWLIKMLWKK